jgi:serine/threonine protein kinase/transposase
MIADRVWDDADSLGPALLARRFESDWRAEGRRPDPADYLPAEPDADPASLLAVLRADLALRWEGGEPARVESYLVRFPRLGGAVLVALLYEEYCLREEAGEGPNPAEYEARFPEAAAELRQVLEIHSLVRKGPSTIPADPARPPAAPFPEVGQTIAGFRLVEELGRGSFARVFRAEEGPLANRSVALKVARAGSREPQALARLQHTHIVPIHSYLTDPATGLHLLCMPYLGRTTLADVLAHSGARSLRSGADLVALLDRLRAADDVLAARPAGRIALARRGFARAIAWWGARLAEALQHAHDRGVLHRDVKPSNVLITADGLPMLLDFNLAHESWCADPSAPRSAPGGTLAYMAPEHLEALAAGAADRVDGRADVYALGVVLFETLTAGRRPFEPPAGGSTMPEALRRAAADRRAGPPRLRAIRRELPGELDAVVGKCLALDPASRYANPGELAADLQAVTDDAPLTFAAEPWAGRVRRWTRRNRRRLALAAPVVLALSTRPGYAYNSGMIRIQLDPATRDELQRMRRQDLPARVRDRLEMVLLADAGWTAARIATHLRCHYRTALNVLHDFRDRGRAALVPRRRGPAPDLARRAHVAGLLPDLLAEDRTWTSAQLAEALRQRGVALSPRQVRRHLRGLRSRYRRTASAVKHKQDPAKAARAAAVLGNLIARAEAGLLDLVYLDECGFAPSLPTGYSWSLPGRRKRVRYEYPQGRRVNALVSYRPFGAAPRLAAAAFERTLTSDDLLAYLRGMPAAGVPRVVVLDNASLHVSKVVKAERRELARRGIFLYYLPANSPELNRIEPAFKQIKHHEIPHRSHTSKAELRASVESGFETYGRKLDPKTVEELRPAA